MESHPSAKNHFKNPSKLEFTSAASALDNQTIHQNLKRLLISAFGGSPDVLSISRKI